MERKVKKCPLTEQIESYTNVLTTLNIILSVTDSNYLPKY